MSEKTSDDIRLWDSAVGFWSKYALTYGTLFGAIAVGFLIKSDALQWIGGIVWILALFGWAHSYSRHVTKSPQEAADYLAKKYNVIGRP